MSERRQRRVPDPRTHGSDEDMRANKINKSQVGDRTVHSHSKSHAPNQAAHFTRSSGSCPSRVVNTHHPPPLPLGWKSSPQSVSSVEQAPIVRLRPAFSDISLNARQACAYPSPCLLRDRHGTNTSTGNVALFDNNTTIRTTAPSLDVYPACGPQTLYPACHKQRPVYPSVLFPSNAEHPCAPSNKLRPCCVYVA